jgi:hypothetical protein
MLAATMMYRARAKDAETRARAPKSPLIRSTAWTNIWNTHPAAAESDRKRRITNRCASLA